MILLLLSLSFGSGEEFPHVNFWDYTNGKRGSGGISGAIPIKQ
jgi:hypothetical protein